MQRRRGTEKESKIRTFARGLLTISFFQWVQENCLVRREGNYAAAPVAENEKEKTNLQVLRAKVIYFDDPVLVMLIRKLLPRYPQCKIAILNGMLVEWEG